MGVKRFSLVPELMLGDVYKINPEFLSEKRIRGILFDLDNTLAPYDAPIPCERLCNFFKELSEKGIIIGLISNNKKERVELFNASLGCYTAHKARKPSPKSIKKFLADNNLTPEQVLFVGDQLFTDCLSAHLAGICCVIVEPIKPDTGLFFRLKRALERPFVSAYRNRG